MEELVSGDQGLEMCRNKLNKEVVHDRSRSGAISRYFFHLDKNLKKGERVDNVLEWLNDLFE